MTEIRNLYINKYFGARSIQRIIRSCQNLTLKSLELLLSSCLSPKSSKLLKFILGKPICSECQQYFIFKFYRDP